MKLADILRKIAAGEALTDEEKAFCGKYDEQSVANAAAAKARREAEAKAADLQAKLDALQTETQKTVTKKDADYAALADRVKALETSKAEADAKLAKIDRSAKIKAAFEKAGIKAAKGVSESAFQKLVDIATENVDISQEESLKTAIESFKAEYTGVIASEGASGTGRTHQQQEPKSEGSAKNPWKEGSINLTEQMRILNSNRAEAERLASEAGVTLEPQT